MTNSANEPTSEGGPFEQPRQAPPVGRVLRILLGLVLMVYVAPVYFRVPARITMGSSLLVLGLIGVYILIHIFVSRRIGPFGPGFGAVVANGFLSRCTLLVPRGYRFLAAEKVSSQQLPFSVSHW